MIEPDAPVVVVGAGQAGSQFAVSLREGGHGGPITLIGDESWLPYQRPPLSKAGDLSYKFEPQDVQLRSPSSYERAQVAVLCGDAVVGIDRGDRRITLASSRKLNYGHLVLATGTRPRSFPVLGADLRGVHYLRTLDDANQLRPLLGSAANTVVIGGGLIGLEIAAAAAVHRRPVTVVEMSDRIMAPAVSPAVTTHVEGVHDRQGTRFRRSSKVDSLVDGGRGRVSAVVLGDGGRLPADLVVVAIGVEPNTTLAAGSGLRVDNGIAVDGQLRTSDKDISAIGDCASFPDVDGHPIRLESVQNATDQARFLSANLIGAEGKYRAVPWFWSSQFDMKLQFAGLGTELDQCVVIEGSSPESFSVFRFAGSELVRVESVNSPLDHVAARRVLSRTCCRISPEEVSRQGFSLRSALKCGH